MLSSDSNQLPHEDEVPFLSEVSSPTSPTTREVSQNALKARFDVDCGNQQSRQGVSNIKRRLYVSHFLSTWNSRVFEFGAVLMLANIYKDTLLPASVYALVRAASAICLSSVVGHHIDHQDRLKVVRLSIIGQRSAVILSCPGFWILGKTSVSAASVSWILFSLMAVLACLEKLCSIMNLVAIERDWVVVIADNTQCELDVLNSQMRRIDLICKLLGPLVIALVDARSSMWTIEAIFVMSALSVLIEYFTIATVYGMVPALRCKEAPVAVSSDLSPVAHNTSILRRLPTLCIIQTRTICSGLFEYSQHAAFLPSFALCLLYLTVLSFSGQMITYLLSAGLSSFQIGLFRTISTVVELSATWLAPIGMDRIGPLRSGLWFVNWQVTCLLGAVASFWVIHQPIVAASVLVAGTIASRIGLWGFDLCVQIIVQEEVQADSRGSFSSLEAALQNFFELCSYISTIVFARPDEFSYPVLISAVALFISGGFYAHFVRKNRGHLLHLSRCLKGKGKRQNQQRTDLSLQDLP